MTLTDLEQTLLGVIGDTGNLTDLESVLVTTVQAQQDKIETLRVQVEELLARVAAQPAVTVPQIKIKSQMRRGLPSEAVQVQANHLRKDAQRVKDGNNGHMSLGLASGCMHGYSQYLEEIAEELREQGL